MAAMLLFIILDKIVIGLGAATILDYCASSGTKYLIFFYHNRAKFSTFAICCMTKSPMTILYSWNLVIRKSLFDTLLLVDWA